MPKSNNTPYIIMGLLNHEPLSGYDIKKRVSVTISHFWNLGYGQIYPALAQLERAGMVTRYDDPSSKGPEKHLYAITGDGKEALKSWLLLPDDKEHVRYEILLKLFFGGRLGSEKNIGRIQAFSSRQEKNLKTIRLFKAELEKMLGEGPDHLNYYLTALFGEYIYSAYIEWSREALKLLGAANK